MNEITTGIDTLVLVALVAALAPFVSALVPGKRLPQVVVLLLGGGLIGEHGLGIANRPSIELFENVGLGFVFLLAGYEVEAKIVRERAGRLALIGWLISCAISVTVVGLLEAT